MEKITLEKLASFGDVYQAIDWCFKQKGEYPDKPKKPFLSNKHTSIEASQYVIDLQIYEKGMETHNEKMKLFIERENEIESIIKEFICDVSGLYSIVPKEYRDKVYSKAWEDGHSSGYYEVYLKLNSLVDIFN